MKTLSFTGSRNINKNDVELAHRLHNHLEEYIQKGYTHYLHGACYGSDFWYAKSTLRHKEKYPHIKLISYVPHLNQSEKWSAEDKEIYKYIIENSDEVVQITNEPYSNYCMKLRNLRLVNDCDSLLSIWNGNRKSGTFQTISLAMDAENVKDIFIIKI